MGLDKDYLQNSLLKMPEERIMKKSAIRKKIEKILLDEFHIDEDSIVYFHRKIDYVAGLLAENYPKELPDEIIHEAAEDLELGL